jgi:hypothetical protein
VEEPHVPRRDELSKVRDEVRGAPQTGVLLEVGVVGSVKQGLAPGSVVGELLEGQGSPSDILRQGLSGRVIVAGKAYGVVHREPGVPSAQEGFGELLRDEAEFQEQADIALTQELREACGVMDGEKVELALGVEAALEDERVEVRVESERITEVLIGGDGRDGDGLGGRGGVELGEEEGPLLAAGRAEVETPTRKGAEVLMAALGVRTAYASNALSIVAAGEEACCHAGDPLDAEGTELLRVACIVLRREAREVVPEHMLQHVGAPLGIGHPR